MMEYEQQGKVDQLETLLQMLENSQHTGIVDVQRGKGGVSEKGNLIVLYGRVVDAHIGERAGYEALQWLLTWGICQYTLHTQPASDIAVHLQPLAPPAPVNEASSPFTFIAQMFSGNNAATREAENTHEHPLPTNVAPVKTEPLPAETWRSALPTVPVAELPPQTQPYTSRNDTYPVQKPFPKRMPVAENAPSRLVDGPQALAYMQRLHLSRLHRHIFFLLDGQRTTTDLARLTGHSLVEIRQLLAELERAGLIKQDKGTEAPFW